MNVHRSFGAMRGLIGFAALVLFAANLFGQNLVVQWKFDEAAGGTVDAVDSGAAPATSGVFGTTATRTADTPGGGPGFAADLSAAGSNSILDGGNPLEVDTLAALTFSTWVKVTGTTHYNEGGSVNVRLLAKQSGGAFDGFSWNMNAPLTPPGSQNNFRTGLFVGGNSGFQFGFSTADIVDRGGQWFFLAVTYDGASTADNARFYIGDENTPVAQLGDPVSIASGPVNSTNIANGGIADARFGVGFTDAAPTADTALTGFQDDVRVYDGVLDLAALDAVRVANLPSVMGLPGDYNDNGTVDAADYVVWRDNEGTDNMLANNSLPGPIGPAHYNQWRANFGRSLGGSGTVRQAAVPEPAAFALMVLGAGMLLRNRCFERRWVA